MNYGETLVYWYLRLNGFFLIRDFVLHRIPHRDINNRQDNADVDLLAVRFPFVHEKYGDVNSISDQWDDDWDKKLFVEIPELNTKIVGLIVEVKTGGNIGDFSSFDGARIKADIHRLGLFQSPNIVDKLTEDLQERKIMSQEGYSIGKLLISENPKPGAWINITFMEVDKYISDHMKKYIDTKYAGRHMFPDDLIQYIIWQEKHYIKKII